MKSTACEEDAANQNYYSEILEFVFNEAGKATLFRKWRYNLQLECVGISEFEPDNDDPDDNFEHIVASPARPKDWTPRFKLGELLKVKFGSPIHHGHAKKPMFGVVGILPLTYEQWQQKFPKHEWETNYYLSYIDMDSGNLDHNHPEEEELEPASWDELPAELEFLRRVSQHFSGERPFSKETFHDMSCGEYYLLNKKTLDEIPEE